MSQRAVERAVGKLVTDEGFRAAFFRDPGAAAVEAGLELSSCELAALTSIPTAALRVFCACLDDRICRLPLPTLEEDPR